MYIKYSPARITIKGYKRNNCTINAIGTALGISYDLARKILQTGVYYNGEFTFVKSNPRTKMAFTKRSHVKRICEALSLDRNVYITDEELRQRRMKGIRKNPDDNSLKRFAECNPEGIFIVLVRSHLVAVINGKIIDTWDSSDRAVEIAYRIDVNEARETIAELAKFYRMNSKEHLLDNHIEKILNKSK